MSEISRQQRRAAERAKAKRLRGEPQQGSNTRVLVAASISALLVLVIATLVLVKFSQGSDSNTATRTTTTSAAARSVMSLPASAFNAVGYQKDVTLPSAIKGAAVNANGKPVVIYLGAEYCPYCAAQRWAMVAALGRFGTFTKLGSTTSSSIDVFPSTPTFTFHKSVYSSPYVVLSAVETASNKVKNNHYAPLDQPTKEQIAAYNAHNSAGTIPFTDFGGKYALTGSSYNPQVLQGLTPNQIAADLHDPNSTVAKAVLGSANGLTAAICSATGGKPANVCSSSAVTATAPHPAK